MQLRKTASAFIVMLIMLMATSLSFASEFGPAGMGIPDDPTDDNSCYPGGQWEGLCTDDYQWNTGWYHIRFIRGEITLGQVPDAYKMWMPQPEQVEPGTSPVKPPTDTDGDGVPDSSDACPSTFGPAIYNGCPDSDGDGVPENGSDWCPGQPGSVSNNGCPDSDGDGVSDMMDSCVAAPGDPAHNGCPDSDGDGFYDDTDMCTGIYSTTNLGCPANDSDFDGVPDASDLCPFQQAPPGDPDGCPDGGL